MITINKSIHINNLTHKKANNDLKKKSNTLLTKTNTKKVKVEESKSIFVKKSLLLFNNNSVLNNNKLNKKKVTFFFFNKGIHLLGDSSFKKHGHYQKWTYFSSRLWGMNNKLINYLLPFLGIHEQTLFTNTDEYFFIYFKYILRQFFNFFSLSWFIQYLKQRSYLLPSLVKGIRFIKHLPSRGQRTRSNYNTIKKYKKVLDFKTFKKKVNKQTITVNYPSWKQSESFYFHRF